MCVTIGVSKGQQKETMTILIPADVYTIGDWEELYEDTAVCCDIISIYNTKWKAELLKEQLKKPNNQNFSVPHCIFGDPVFSEITGTTITFRNSIARLIFKEDEKPNQCYSWELFLDGREDVVTSFRSDETEVA